MHCLKLFKKFCGRTRVSETFVAPLVNAIISVFSSSFFSRYLQVSFHRKIKTFEDLDEVELMKFFSKQGATTAIVAHARTSSFASVTFPGTPEVARFLSRIAHAYADEKGTLIARLLPKEAKMDEIPTLPALPAPNLTTTNSAGEELESGNLMVFWSPLVLAVAYTVELRPVGSANTPWSSVDVTSKKLGAVSNRFDSNCSSCVVNSHLAPVLCRFVYSVQESCLQPLFLMRADSDDAGCC